MEFEITRVDCICLCKSKYIAVNLGELFLHLIETAHDKTYNKACVTSKDSGQPVHPPSTTRVLVYPSLDSPEAPMAHAIGEDSDQSARKGKLIRIFPGRTNRIVGFIIIIIIFFYALKHILVYILNHLCRIDSTTSTFWAGPFPAEGVSG